MISPLDSDPVRIPARVPRVERQRTRVSRQCPASIGTIETGASTGSAQTLRRYDRCAHAVMNRHRNRPGLSPAPPGLGLVGWRGPHGRSMLGANGNRAHGRWPG